MTDTQYRVKRRTDKLWLTSVSRNTARWEAEESKALEFTQDELLNIRQWTLDCDFVIKPINFMELYYVG